MAEVQSFEPIIGQQPRVVILGSMPGVASLEAVQYYAHPRNAFWPIMGELFDINPTADYTSRIRQMASRPLILWDTLKSCRRPGSLDSNIELSSAQANDFPGLLSDYRQVCAICFNGAASERYFRQLVVPQLDLDGIELVRMPSTSPANAGMTYRQKLDAWRRLLDFV